MSATDANTLNIRTTSGGEWVQAPSQEGEVVLYEKNKTKPDGNCLFQALVCAQARTRVCRVSHIGGMRTDIVEHMAGCVKE